MAVNKKLAEKFSTQLDIDHQEFDSDLLMFEKQHKMNYLIQEMALT
jgi:hypothetical protein